MAVGTSHIAFVYLFLKQLYAHPHGEQTTHVVSLAAANVIKIKHYRIGLSAVHARMRKKVGVDVPRQYQALLSTASVYLRKDAFAVVGEIEGGA